jgi:DNA-binding CsgD family transcriptional regulator
VSLVGRADELARVERLLDAARDGRSEALLLAGEAGIGKTALLRHGVEQARAAGLLVLAAHGVQSESDLPFAGLSELLGPRLERLDAIPAAQAAALRGALALSGTVAPSTQDRFAVSAAVLSLLAGAAEEQPVLVAVDDIQWLDPSSLESLLFAGRRLRAEGIALLATLRTGHSVPAPWLDRLEVPPLPAGDARALLRTVGGEPLAPSVTERLVQDAAGNPLALLEIPTLLSPAQRAGREPLETPLPAGTGIERAFRRRVDVLPEPARRALLVVACADSARLPVVLQGLEALELDEDALEPAETADLVRIAGGRVEFRHPLVRSTAYHAAPAAERRAVHRALAGASPEGSAERAWHLAAAAIAPDETVAAALEAAALDARRRGAIGTAARDLGRAAQLTPAPADRAKRLLEAGRLAGLSGDSAQAKAFLTDAEPLAGDPAVRDEIRRARANVDLRSGRPLAACAQFLALAEAARGEDPLRAALLYIEAAVTQMPLAEIHELHALAERGRDLAAGREPGLELLATLLIGEAQVILGDTETGRALLGHGRELVLEGDVLELPPELVGMVGHCALWLEDFDDAQAIVRRIVAFYRQASAIVPLIYPLSALALIDHRLGRWGNAAANVGEAVTLAEQTGNDTLWMFCRSTRALIGATMGAEAQVREDAAVVLAGPPERQISRYFAIAALGHLELSLGRAGEAAAVLAPLVELTERLGLRNPTHAMWEPDLVEALARADRLEDALAALALLEERVERTGGRWHRAAVLRCRGLFADDFRALFEDALALHAELPLPFERARTQLAYGERLRRAGARADAREPLRAALDTFERLGAPAWAELARAELRAAGQASATRTQAAGARLTPHELQVALLVSQGMTNREAAAALFLSPKTIEYHLGQIYRKLEVRGRSQLARLMAQELPEGDAVAGAA